MKKNNSMPYILFICHGGSEVGMGHVMRCLTLASAFHIRNCNIEFFSKYEEGINKIRDLGYHVYDKGSELDCIHYNTPDIVVIDTYQVTFNFFKEIKNIAFTVYIDDLNAFEYPVDIILNGNITGLYMGYKKHFSEQIRLLGIEYNLLRSEFTDISKKVVREKPECIMITTGASDPVNMTCQLLNALLSDEYLKTIKYHVIIGSGFRYADEIKSQFQDINGVCCHIDPDRMSDIMLDSDVAICAGGSTLYELAACGVPSLAFIYAENQRTVVEYMSNDYIVNLGFYTQIQYDQLISKLKIIMLDYQLRKVISAKMQQLADGKGSERAAEDILNRYYNRMKSV